MQLTQSYVSGYPGDQKASAGYMWVIARIQRRIIKDLGESNKNILFTCKTKFLNQMEEGVYLYLHRDILPSYKYTYLHSDTFTFVQMYLPS